MTNTLTPEQEKRFDEEYPYVICDGGDAELNDDVKQHLANELQRQKKMLIKNVKNTWKKRFKEEKRVALQKQREELLDDFTGEFLAYHSSEPEPTTLNVKEVVRFLEYKTKPNK